MRKIPIREDKPLSGCMKMKSDSIFHKNKSLSSILENSVVAVEMEEGDVPFNNSEIKDDILSEDKTWSSKKIQEELKKCHARISNLTLVENGEEVEEDVRLQLQDLKIDVDGNRHASAGDAVRSELEKMKLDVEDKVSKERFEKINRYQSNCSSISNDGIIVKPVNVNGEDCNILKVPMLKGYILESANNGNYDSCQCYTVGVAQKNTTPTSENYVFMNRVIKKNEVVCLNCVYVKFQR